MIEELTQVTIDTMAYFLPSFSVLLVISWVCSLFRFNR